MTISEHAMLTLAVVVNIRLYKMTDISTTDSLAKIAGNANEQVTQSKL